jgi:hypothetical protein
MDWRWQGCSKAMLAIRCRFTGRRITVGEDKAYDTVDHVAKLRAAEITPHVTQNNGLIKTGRQRAAAPSMGGPPVTAAMPHRNHVDR